MSKLQEGLNARFERIMVKKDHEDFFSALIDYLRFVVITPALNTIAQSTLADSPSLRLMDRLYEELRRALHNDETRELMYDSGHNPFRKPRKYDVGIFGADAPIQLARLQVREFHKLLRVEIPRWTRGGKPVIGISKNRRTIYWMEDKARHYEIMSRGTYKRERPASLGIILFLNKQLEGMPAIVLAQKLKVRTPDVSNIRARIKKINEQFRRKLRVQDDLIVWQKHTRKHIYTLNRDAFDFKLL